MSATPFQSFPGALRPAPSRLVWIVGGALGLVSLAAAGAVAIRSALPEAQADEPVRAAATPVAAATRTTLPARLAALQSTCADCGVVESVRSFTRKGRGAGLGASAGHEIEKRARSSHTVHEVRVRMDDGSLRTIEQVQPEAHAGDRVVVQGNTLKPGPESRS